MGIPHYLAMTAAELSQNPLPSKIAWMACHFSPYSDGLSNFPTSLPPGSLLVLDDSTPVGSHSPDTILRQLAEQLQAQQWAGLLLDFQRPGFPQLRELAELLTSDLSCPVAVSQRYSGMADCPVFLAPGPLHVPLADYLAPWKGRDIWLETALGREVLTLTQEGCQVSTAIEFPAEGFHEETLHCHYQVETGENYARFTLWRTPEDLDSLLAEAEALGVTAAVGLWQELHR